MVSVSQLHGRCIAKKRFKSTSCSMWYTRLTEPLNDWPRLLTEKPHSRRLDLATNKVTPQNRRNPSANVTFGPKYPGNLPGGNKRAFDIAQPSNEITPFKRVRLIHRKHRFEQEMASSTERLTTKMKKRESRLGSLHPRTVKAMVALAGNFRTQRKFNAAEKLLQRALDLQDKQSYTHDLGLLRVFEAMITVLVDQNKLDRAEGMSRELIKLLQERLGSNHIDTAQGEEQLLYILQLRKHIPNDVATGGSF